MLTSVRLYIHARAQVLSLKDRVHEIMASESIAPSKKVPALTSDFGVTLHTTVPRDCSVLVFWASSVPIHRFRFGAPRQLNFGSRKDGHFKLDWQGEEETSAEYIPILDHKGTTCGRLLGTGLPETIYLKDLSHRLIALSKYRVVDKYRPLSVTPQTWPLIHVLLVVEKAGYCERITIGQVTVQFWELAEPALCEVKLS
jgi:hypothetical protein